MLAHNQAGLLNTSQLARNLGLDVKTAGGYLDLLADLARRLRRDRAAVTRDVRQLARFGVVEVTEKPLPGHGRQKWIRAASAAIELVARV